MTQTTEFPRDLLQDLAAEAHPKSKHPHYGVQEASIVLNAILGLGGRAVFPQRMSEAEIREHVEWVQSHVG